jgi:excisionase family DNA binding protein
MHSSAEITDAAQGIGGDQIAYTVKNAAKVLDVGERVVWALVKAEEEQPGTGIESIKIGRSRRIPRAALLAYVNKQRRAQPVGKDAA